MWGKMLKNKKGGFYALILVIIVILLVAYLFYGMSISRKKIVSSLSSPAEVIEFSNNLDKEEIYEYEKLKNTAVKAFYDTAAQGVVKTREECKFSGEYVIFHDACEPTINEISEVFIKNLESKDENYDFSFEKGKIIAIKEPTTKTLVLTKAFTTYSLEYDIKNNYVLELNDIDLELEKFIDAYNKAKVCKDSENVLACVNLENWELEFKEEGYKFFKFKTKAFYFYNHDFKPIEFNFALE